MKKLAIIASGWHYPIHFYESLARQKKVEGWDVELYCVSHRAPRFSKLDKAGRVYDDTLRGKLDKTLYRKIATVSDIKKLGWHYKEYPNTIGDWGNSNQWLEEHNYKDYDLFLFTHDDNLILNNLLVHDTVLDENYPEWDILTNSPGMPPGILRGSFEFFKTSVLEKMGGRFELPEAMKRRVGVTTSSTDLEELTDWNLIVYPIQKLIKDHELRTAYLSPCYRVSAYCIEGERGFISLTHGVNTHYEDAGLKLLQDNGAL